MLFKQDPVIVPGVLAHGYRLDTGSNNNKTGENEKSEGDEGAYDWEGEAKKPAKQKGFQSLTLEQLFRYREMVWKKRDGRWSGSWKWTAWKDSRTWTKRIEDRQEHAIYAWNVGDVPQEILLRVVESLVGQGLSFTHEVEATLKAGRYPPSVGGLSNLALVCRAWRDHVAPALYSKLTVTDGSHRIPLGQTFTQYARWIAFKSNRPFAFSARIAQFGPRPSSVVRLELRGTDRKYTRHASAYHPSHAAIYTQIHRSYSKVVTLELSHCSFLSSSDLLRLLAAFSALERVLLVVVAVGHSPDSIVRRAHPSVSPIRYIHTYNNCRPPRLPFLSQCWTWPWGTNRGPAGNALNPVEQQLVVRILRLMITEGGAYYHLDRMDDDACVMTSESDSLQVEFHTRQGDSRHPGTARVHHCLLRLEKDVPVYRLKDFSIAIGDTLAGFAYLETFILETNPLFATDGIPSLLDSLRKVTRAEVHHRTCEQAHRLALQAKKSPSRSTSAGLLPVSPFWCLRKYASNWDMGFERNGYVWLPKDYWNSLSDEDKQPWDPSCPPAISSASSN